MKKLQILLFLTVLFSGCAKAPSSYVKTFEKFCNSLENRNMNDIKKHSTESTAHIISAWMERKIESGNPLLRLVDENIEISGRKIQYNIQIVGDSLSSDGRYAKIWFTINDSAERYIADLVNINGEWKIDIPMIN
ncbi:hypothetical protein BN938_2385 [Mucinivorans hirudinis]|uniref:DUF4878 domain-containing protein n=1 Tax=Mucinivorans hirudinis TaxID=1433126 RepID=A0A060RA03_9BACT|nr:hypothetical protein BN938_2385 [Mucinivorans hirudinis]